jgi:Co/Zn/Cd efflux system component
MEGAIVSLSFFTLIFGITYLYFSTRHKERVSLIEKGVDASIFFTPKSPRSKSISVWKILIVNIAMICIGVGFGIIFGSLLEKFTIMGDAGYAASVFLTTGIALLAGYFMTKSMEKSENGLN